MSPIFPHRFKTTVIWSLAFSFLLAGFQAIAEAKSYTVRVAILKDVKSFPLSVRGVYSIIDQNNQREITSRKRIDSIIIEAGEWGIRLGEEKIISRHLFIQPGWRSVIEINGRRFRGGISIIKQSSGLLTVVNAVDLEEYIKGVLYHEVSHRWPLEAIKAQAVAARTYALYRMSQNRSRDYDLTNDIYSQVYGGRNSERYRTSIAVERTRGMILIYDRKILPAYFHATCGGHTEDASELWDEDLRPLKGRSCPYCRHSPHYLWKKNFQLKEIQEKLNEAGYSLWLIKDIRVLDRNQSGRIKMIQITTRDNKSITLSGKKFRSIIGPNIIKSNNYEPIMKGYYMDLIGKGWGHGVGLCQWGANFMARQRFEYRDILEFYYPGAYIQNYETSKIPL